MKELSIWIAVAAGGGVGACLRYTVGLISHRMFGDSFPIGTLIVNATGSFAMGLVVAWLIGKGAADSVLKPFLMVGVLGAFTTFSTFSLDFISLIEKKAFAAAGGYMLGSLAFSIGGLVLGLWLGRIAS